MHSETQIAELLSLLKDTREQLAYFKELGVEGTEKPLAVPSANLSASDTESSGALSFQHAAVPNPSTPLHGSRTCTLNGKASSLPQTRCLEISALRLSESRKSSETFEDIWADVGDCTRCPLYQGRTNIVHTEGNRRARLMFVGEAPGADEDAQARPFVGRAGKLLTKIIEAIGFKREDVLIGNVNRCRPPANRPPTPEEAAMCKPFLLREIAAVQPEVIVVLGNTAMRNLLDIKQGITRVRGQFQDYHGVKVMPTFHPAYLLRDPSKKKETWEDLKKVRDYLDATRKPEN